MPIRIMCGAAAPGIGQPVSGISSIRLRKHAVGRDFEDQLSDHAASIVAVAFVVPALHPCGEVVDSDRDDYQRKAFNGHDEFVHSRSISRAMAARSM